MASVEDILLYKAQLDGEERGENNLETAAVGALLGSASGLETQRRLIESVEKLTGGPMVMWSRNRVRSKICSLELMASLTTTM